MVTGTCDGNYIIQQDLILIGAGLSPTLDADGTGVTLTIRSPDRGVVDDDPPSVGVTGLTVRGGNPGVLVEAGASAALNKVGIDGNPGPGMVLTDGSYVRGRDVTITANGGDGLENLGSRAELIGAVVSHNAGHGIVAYEQAQTDVSVTRVSHNHGRGVLNQNSSLTMTDSLVAMNTDGGLYSDGRAYLVVTDSEVIGNRTGAAGGGVYLGMPPDPIDGSARLDDVIIVANEAFGSGGGMFIEAGRRVVSLANVAIRENRAGAGGGGIHNSSDLPIGAEVSLEGNEPNDCSGC